MGAGWAPTFRSHRSLKQMRSAFSKCVISLCRLGQRAPPLQSALPHKRICTVEGPSRALPTEVQLPASFLFTFIADVAGVVGRGIAASIPLKRAYPLIPQLCRCRIRPKLHTLPETGLRNEPMIGPSRMRPGRMRLKPSRSGQVLKRLFLPAGAILSLHFSRIGQAHRGNPIPTSALVTSAWTGRIKLRHSSIDCETYEQDWSCRC